VDALSYKTKFANKATANKEWLLVDAENEVVGRLASKVAMLLRGKHKTSYTPHSDSGSNVIIINADKVRFTGKKLTDKEYVRYTGYPGGQRFASPKQLMENQTNRNSDACHPRDVAKRSFGSYLKHQCAHFCRNRARSRRTTTKKSRFK
jgi:large subunit ribosomal protein L13